jgi:hypothetical protein
MSVPSTIAPHRPILLWIAVLIGTAILPLIMLLDRSARNAGGDGLQQAWAAVFVYLGCVAVSSVCLAIGVTRGERPRWPILPAIASWILPLLAMLM